MLLRLVPSQAIDRGLSTVQPALSAGSHIKKATTPAASEPRLYPMTSRSDVPKR